MQSGNNGASRARITLSALSPAPSAYFAFDREIFLPKHQDADHIIRSDSVRVRGREWIGRRSFDEHEHEDGKPDRPSCIERARSSDNSVNLIAFREQKLRKV